ncbi:ribosome recycling factor family protein [Vibrio ostreae]|uniref:Ribosome recycling factor family protein n=1 Tax=Vibrio ostreae TaxID=2841925 RepID=A0A975U5D5_9VIBR|nr:ribosome recycling factor family protein [Vibrio ostreae]QXO15458.1 ribosome recycling factor family protein [Vibrio ostreae]
MPKSRTKLQDNPLPDKANEVLTIALPSLIHRIGRLHTQVLKQLALAQQCELKRVRRSRHWQLSGQGEQLAALLRELHASPDAEAIRFVTQKLTVGIEAYQRQTRPNRLVELIRTSPGITLAELVQQTGCTLAEARAAREAHEWQQ